MNEEVAMRGAAALLAIVGLGVVLPPQRLARVWQSWLPRMRKLDECAWTLSCAIGTTAP